MALSKILENSITDGVVSAAKLKDFAAAVDLNGVELILDADQDTSITADTDDQIDIRIAGADHLKVLSSSGDTVLKPMVDAKDIIFQQFDGNKLFCIDDGNFVSVGGNAAAPGEIRIYEDTDNGTHYTGFKAGNNTASVAYVLPLADGTSGHQLTTDGSGTLSWSSAGTTLANDGNNRVVTGTGSGLNGEANLTFDGSTLAVTGAITGSSDLTLQDDLILDSDSAVLSFGEDNEITITHVADTGLNIKHTATGDDKPIVLTLQTGETDIAANDVIGTINFQAPDEGTGTDAILVAAGISAISEGDFSSSANATKLSFKTAVSAAASETMSLTSNGDLFIAGGLIDLKNDGNAVSQIKFYCESSNAHAQTLIGAPHSEGADNVLTLPGTGGNARLVSTTSTATLTNKTLTTPVIAEIDSGSTITLDATTDIVLDADGGDIFFKDAGTTFGSATNTSGNLIIKSGTTTAATFSGANVTLAGTVGSGNITSTGTVQGTTITATTAFVPDASDGAALGTTALEFSDLFLADGAVISFGDDQEVTLTHVADTGLLLSANDQLQFGDSGTYIHQSADGVLDLVSDTEIEINATTIDINGNVQISGTAVTTGVHTFTAVPVFPNNTVETADIQADAITGAKIADDAIDSEHYTDGSIDTAHIGADQITNAKIADDQIDSEHYVDGSIDTAHIADAAVSIAKMKIESETELSARPATGDEFVIYDASASANRRINYANLSTGKVLQIQNVNFTGSNTAVSSTTFSATEVTDQITPSAADSKVLVMMTLTLGMYENSGTGNFCQAAIYRQVDGGGYSKVSYGNADNAIDGQGGFGSGTEISSNRFVTFQFLDSPNTTTAVDYKLYIRLSVNSGGGDSVNTGPSNLQRTVTLMEIGA